MSKTEYINVVGLRQDGRRPDEPRRTRCSFSVSSHVDGSACFEQGLTKVVAVVQGPRQVRNWSDAQHDRAVVRCEYAEAAFASSERKQRRGGDRAWTEAALAIQQTFEAVLMLELYPRTQIDIFVTVLHGDGGKLSASINAVSLALVDAGIAMRDFVVSCNCGFLQQTPLVDLNFSEESADGPDLPVAIFAKTEEVTLLQMNSKVPIEVFEELLALATRGAQQIYDVLKNEVREHTLRLLSSRGGTR